MSRSHSKRLTPKKYAERTPPERDALPRARDKTPKQRRVNERVALRKEYR